MENNGLDSRLTKLGLMGPACAPDDLRHASQCGDCHDIYTGWHKTYADLRTKENELEAWYGADLSHEICCCGCPSPNHLVRDINFPRHITTPVMLLRQWIVHGNYRKYAWRLLLRITRLSEFKDISMDPVNMWPHCDRGFLRQVCAIDKNLARPLTCDRASGILCRYFLVEKVLGGGLSADQVVGLLEGYLWVSV